MQSRFYIRDVLHTGYSIYGMFYIQDILYMGCSTYRIFYIRDVLHTGYSIYGMFYIQDILYMGCSTYRIFYIRDVLHTGYSIYGMFYIQDILYTECSIYRMFCDATAELQERVVQIVWKKKICLLNCSSFWHYYQVPQCRTLTLIIHFLFNVPLLSTFQTFTTTLNCQIRVRNVQHHTVAHACCQSLFHWMLPMHASCFLFGINSDMIYVF